MNLTTNDMTKLEEIKLESWQQRVIDEQRDLQIKIDKLQDFLKNEFCPFEGRNNKHINFPELEVQLAAMKTYNMILRKRICEFK